MAHHSELEYYLLSKHKTTIATKHVDRSTFIIYKYSKIGNELFV